MRLAVMVDTGGSHLASRISHLASRISHLASRISECHCVGRCACGAADCGCAAAERGCPPRAGAEGRLATPLCTPGRPRDHHHRDLAVVLPAYGVATMCHPWPIVAFGNVLLPQPLLPASRGLFGAVRVVIEWDLSVAAGLALANILLPRPASSTQGGVGCLVIVARLRRVGKARWNLRVGCAVL